eukprot:gene6749-biopygen13481
MGRSGAKGPPDKGDRTYPQWRELGRRWRMRPDSCAQLRDARPLAFPPRDDSVVLPSESVVCERVPK